MSKCRSCGGEIFWIRLTSGKLMPYNILPDLGVGDDKAKMPAYFTDAAGKHYETHFATCPNADQHRRRRKGGALNESM